MPKSANRVKVGQYWKKVKVSTKFRIGTRKGGKSANLMSKDELQGVLADASKAKYWSKAQAVLANRNA